MFDQVKQLNELRKQGKRLQKEMEKITVDVSEGNVRVVMRGDQQIEEVEIDGEIRNDIKNALNKAVKESQKKVSKKLSGMLTDLKIPGL